MKGSQRRVLLHFETGTLQHSPCTCQKHLKGGKARRDWLGLESINGVARKLENCSYSYTVPVPFAVAANIPSMLLRCHKPFIGLTGSCH